MENDYNEKSESKASRRIICTPSPSAKNTFFYVQEAGYSPKAEQLSHHVQNIDSFLIAAVAGGFGELSAVDLLVI